MTRKGKRKRRIRMDSRLALTVSEPYSELVYDRAVCGPSAEQRMQEATQCDRRADGGTHGRSHDSLVARRPRYSSSALTTSTHSGRQRRRPPQSAAICSALTIYNRMIVGFNGCSLVKPQISAWQDVTCVIMSG